MFVLFNKALFEMMEMLNVNNMANNRKQNNGGAITKKTQDVTENNVVKKKIKKPFISKAKLLEPTSNFILIPSKKEDIKIGSLVFAKYKGKYIQHKVSELDPKKGFKVTRKGHVNGWVKNVCTKVATTTILENKKEIIEETILE